MKNIDEILKKAKPEVPELPKYFAQNILQKINEQSLSIAPQKVLKSKNNWFYFTIGILLLGLALVSTNNAIFEVQMSGSLELLSFGTQYTTDFMQYLPLDMIVPTLLIISISSWLLWRSHLIKRGVAIIVAGSFLVTSVGGSALAATSINEQIQSRVINEKSDIPVISWFYKERARYHMKHPEIQMGKVIEKNSDYVVILNPYGETQKIHLPSGMEVKLGQYIRLNGKSRNGEFEAKAMQHCNPTRVGKYFSGMGEMMKNGMKGKMMKHHQMMHGRSN